MVFSSTLRTFSLQTVRLTAARIPSIKFRKGGLATSHQPSPGSSAAPQVKKNEAKEKPKQAPGARGTRTIIVEELPARFKRTPISAEEIACINSGGVR